MGLHHENMHGRVLRGEEALNHLDMHKRDSHGNQVLTNYIPDEYAQKDNSNAVVQTVESVVYVTMSASFSGTVAGYTTLTDASSPSTATTANTDANVQTSATSAAAGTSAASQITASTASATDSASASSISSSSSNVNNKSVFLNPPASAASSTASSSYTGVPLVGAGVQQSSATANVVGGTPLSATRAPNGQISQSENGMSGGAKAGLAIGIILALALAGGLVFFCLRRRKNPEHHDEIVNEKRTSSIFGGRSIAEAPENRASALSTRSASTAPRLSLRPVTQFLPYLTENRKSSGNTLDVAAAPMSEKPKSMWERRPNTENPFADAAVMSEKQARPVSPQNPFEEPEGRKSSSNHSQKSSWEGSEPATPKSTKFGTAAAVPVVAASAASTAPPMPRGPNNVHRVQLDFKPSMDDELELKSGQLVRMLHEYDDGWVSYISS